ncbi:MAG TPA: hypothetical protein VGG98_00470 [Solirubrobacteraceae bacterium]
MSISIALATVVLLAVVVLVVSAPLRAAGRALDPESQEAGGRHAARESAADRAELETAREAKYREIRDAELDYRTGKLSREDYDAVDRALRAEAIEILDRLEAPEEDCPKPRAS